MDRDNVVSFRDRRREAQARVRRHARAELEAARRPQPPGATGRAPGPARDGRLRPPPVRLAWTVLLLGLTAWWLLTGR
jgi:hypothetical protein